MKEEIYPKLKEFYNLANIYVKDGFLIKYRWYSEDKTNFDNILGQCSISNPINLRINENIFNMTEEERNLLIHIATKIINNGNLIVEENSKFTIYNSGEMKDIYEGRIKFLKTLNIRPEVKFEM